MTEVTDKAVPGIQIFVDLLDRSHDIPAYFSARYGQEILSRHQNV